MDLSEKKRMFRRNMTIEEVEAYEEACDRIYSNLRKLRDLIEKL